MLIWIDSTGAIVSAQTGEDAWLVPDVGDSILELVIESERARFEEFLGDPYCTDEFVCRSRLGDRHSKVKRWRMGVEEGHQHLLFECLDESSWMGTMHVLLQTLEGIPSGITIADMSAKDAPLVFVNKAFEQMTGYTRKEILGVNCRFLQGEGTDPGAIRDIANAVRHEHAVTTTLLNYKKDGAPFWNELHMAPLRDSAGDVTHYVGVMIDVTQRIDYQKELAMYADSLEEANEAKNAFMARVSHELRTPLNGIMGMAHLLRDTLVREDQLEALEIIQGSSQALLAMVRDILDFSAIEAGDIELAPERFSPRACLREIVEALAPRAHAKHLSYHTRFDSELPEHMLGDAERIGQILRNLVENAIRFTEEGSVLIDISADLERDQLVLVVRDTGVGIAEDKLGKIFNAFEQADNSMTRVHQGAGMGLAMCAGLCEAMGGAIEVESALGAGSMFTARVSAEALAPAEPTAPRRALLIETNMLRAKLATALLGRSNYVVEHTRFAKQALEWLDHNEHDLVLAHEEALLDWTMAEWAQLELRASQQRAPVFVEQSRDYDTSDHGILWGPTTRVITGPISPHALSGLGASRGAQEHRQSPTEPRG